jgi:ribosome-binding protein aMBF1 (putative translation factor)
MTDPKELLGLALLRVELAADALMTARKALLAAASALLAVEKKEQAIEGERWPQDRVEFGAAVRKAREVCGLTRAQLATRLGISEATVRNVEMGRHGGTAKTRALLIKALVRVPS